VNDENLATFWEGDVAVYGGGPAGLAAATAAARGGADVLLVEKNGYLGGVATAAGVTVFHSLFSPDFGAQVIGGITQEFLERLGALDAAYNTRDDGRGNFVVETEYAKFVADRMVTEAGARLLLHTLLVDAVRDGERIDAAVVANKSGLGRVRARVHVDATGDGDLLARAGLPFEKRDGQLQAPSLCVRLAGVDHAAFDAAKVDVEALLRRRAAEAGLRYTNLLWGTRNHRRAGEQFYSAVRVPGTDATDAWSLSDAEVDARRQLLWMVDVLRKEVPGYRDATILDVGAQLGIRETRRLVGRHVLSGTELLSQQRFADAVAQGSYPVDIHAAGGTGIWFRHLDGRESRQDEHGRWHRGYWTADGKPRDALCYQVPYRCLTAEACGNLLVAGRPISVDAEAHGATRVMVNCMQTGQAAGTAAAMALADDRADCRRLEGAAVAEALRAAGLPLLGTAREPGT
jgi:glycine/D-amino acid oxidase-like deaminating enzyme